MADSAIGSLPAVRIMQNADLLVLEQNGVAMKLSGELLASFIDRNITTVTVVERQATQTYTASYNANTGALTIGIPRGVGISSISDPVVSGLNKTYTITFDKPASASAATKKTFTVKDGNAITGIQAVSAPHTPGTRDSYQINFSEGEPFEFEVYNGQDGYGSAGSSTPLMDGTATAGTLRAYSREDHVHPTDTTRQQKLQVVTVSITESSTEDQIGSVTDARINANTQVIRSEIANPAYQTSDWTVTTYDVAPQLRITGTASAATTVKLILAEVS